MQPSSNEQLVPVEHLQALLAAQHVSPYRGWNISQLNRAADAARAFLGLQSVRELNPDIAAMQDHALKSRAALRTPPAEPVGWVNRRKSDGSIYWSDVWDCKELAETARSDMLDHETIPLYAGTPPAVEPDEGLVGRLLLDFMMLKLPEKYREQLMGNIERNEYEGMPLYDFGRFIIATLTPSIRAQALDEAAKVAEGHKPEGYMSDRERSYCTEHGDEIAASIRALKGGQGV